MKGIFTLSLEFRVFRLGPRKIVFELTELKMTLIGFSLGFLRGNVIKQWECNCNFQTVN